MSVFMCHSCMCAGISDRKFLIAIVGTSCTSCVLPIFRLVEAVGLDKDDACLCSGEPCELKTRMEAIPSDAATAAGTTHNLGDGLIEPATIGSNAIAPV